MDARLVRALLARQFPQLHVDHVRHISEGGARTFEVDGALIFRFASDGDDAAKLRREVALLRELGPQLPLVVPAYEFVGGPSEAFPYPFAGYRRIDGRSGEAYRPAREHWPVVAEQFGAFLSALHAFPIERARELGVPEASNEAFGAEYRVRDGEALLRRVRAFGPVIRRQLPDALTNEAERYLSGSVAVPPRSPLPSVLSHADLKGEHIIVSNRDDAVVGVIDWTDCTITDPLLDFTGLVIWLGEPFVRRVLDHYSRPVDEKFLERVCFYARCFALDNLGWRLSSDWPPPLDLLVTQARWAFS